MTEARTQRGMPRRSWPVAHRKHPAAKPPQPFTQGSGRRVADGASQPEPVLPWDESDSLLEPVERRVGRHGVPEVVS